ncbi:hypothetical protein [Scleromatobacter humisilvae]|uniref:PRTase-CE domain-containing protein n=1 Tax=Scleromatobacter humisilvae TaxID=2897159 RepID=A0A9X1YJW5_9BURK|nr:hypothetical protein [Scleromatobacter humisilvae]MCK9685717.1 hypothetical protein [Scleromatobacter humisilvae]
MAFHVPPTHEGLYDQVVSRFRMLLRRGVITGISDVRLNLWLKNFISSEDQYLAARVLDNLSYRSQAMVTSAIQHVNECVLPCELRRRGIGNFADVDGLVESLRSGDATHPVRFVAVDGSHEQVPGKSGSVVIRQFQRDGVSKALTCKPENLGALPATVKCLVFVDDMLGTGKQFSGFAEHYKLDTYAGTQAVIYCPLVAHQKGLDKLTAKFPWLTLLPVEVFGAAHQFYRGAAKNERQWAIDDENLVDDVREFVKALCTKRNIPATTQHSLNLLLGFEHATPNNSLPLLYAESPQWNFLLKRQT